MPEATQYCVGLDNRPGALAKLCGVLYRAGVNVDALFVSEDEEYTWVNLIGAPTAAMEQALKKEKYHYFTEQVLTLTARNRPGELESVASRLSENGINIDYVYGSTGGHETFTLVLNVTDLPRAQKLLEA